MKFFSALSFIFLMCVFRSADAGKIPAVRDCFPDEVIMLNNDEYEALNAPISSKITLPSRTEVQEFVLRERKKGRSANLTVFFWSRGLFRCPYKGTEHLVLDLRELDLKAVQARHLVIMGNLKVDLYLSNLSDSDLSGSRLIKVQAPNAFFVGAKLDEVRFGGNYTATDFSSASFKKAVMKDENAEKVFFDYNYFYGADFTDVDWRDAQFFASRGLPQWFIGPQEEKRKREEFYNTRKLATKFLIFPTLMIVIFVWMLKNLELRKTVPEQKKELSTEDESLEMYYSARPRKKSEFENSKILIHYSLFMAICAFFIVTNLYVVFFNTEYLEKFLEAFGVLYGMFFFVGSIWIIGVFICHIYGLITRSTSARGWYLINVFLQFLYMEALILYILLFLTFGNTKIF